MEKFPLHKQESYPRFAALKANTFCTTPVRWLVVQKHKAYKHVLLAAAWWVDTRIKCFVVDRSSGVLDCCYALYSQMYQVILMHKTVRNEIRFFCISSR